MKAQAFVLASLFILFDLVAQSQLPLPRRLYSVDKQIELALKRFRLVDSGRLEKSMKIRVMSKNFTMFDTYERDKPLDCYTTSHLGHDTIYITGYMIGQLGWGFQLVLYKDTCVVAPFALSDGKIYKYNVLDRDSIDYILLRSVTSKLVLSKKPSFKEGESIEGLVELKSVPFYYTDFEGKFVIDLQAYFKTASLRGDE